MSLVKRAEPNMLFLIIKMWNSRNFISNEVTDFPSGPLLWRLALKLNKIITKPHL